MLNLIARWFDEITRKRSRRGTFRSVPELIRAIEDYVTHHNRHAEPFIWTATAATTLKKVRHCREALETAHEVRLGISGSDADRAGSCHEGLPRLTGVGSTPIGAHVTSK